MKKKLSLLQMYLRDMKNARTGQVPPLTLKDGTFMSVQASVIHYCRPRNNLGPWTEVEIGFPSERIDELEEYAEDWDNPTNTVYAYVPIDLVEKIIEDRGGLKI